MIMPDQKIKRKIVPANIKHFISLNYDVRFGDIIEIPQEHLSKEINKKLKTHILFGRL